jgi:hypothetical protein
MSLTIWSCASGDPCITLTHLLRSWMPRCILTFLAASAVVSSGGRAPPWLHLACSGGTLETIHAQTSKGGALRAVDSRKQPAYDYSWLPETKGVNIKAPL